MRLLALLLAISAGCAGQSSGWWSARATTYVTCSAGECYQVGPLGPAWQVVRQKDGALGFFNAANGGIILSNATCRDDAESTPLASLTAHLLVGYTERRERSRELLEFARREALRSVVDARLDGVPVVLDLYVFKRNGCIFDLSYSAPPGGYASGLADFQRFVGGFKQLQRRAS